MIEIRLPKPGPEIEEATITSWECAEGDKIGIGDILAIIKTPVGSFKVAAEEQGIMESILQHEGDSINFEEPIAMLKPELTISDFKEDEEADEAALPFPEETDSQDELETPEDSWEEEIIDLPEEPEAEEETNEEEPVEVEEAQASEIDAEVSESEEAEPITEAQEPEPIEEDTEEESEDSELISVEEPIPFDIPEDEDQEGSEAQEEDFEETTESDEEVEEELESESIEEDAEEENEHSEPISAEEPIPFDIPEDEDQEEPEAQEEDFEETTESDEEVEEVSEEEPGFPESLEFEISPAAMKLADQAGIDIKAVKGSGENGKIHYIDVENAIWERAKANQAHEQAEPEEELTEDESTQDTEIAPEEDEDFETHENAYDTDEGPTTVDSEEQQETNEEIHQEQIPDEEDKPLAATFDDVSIQYNMEQKEDLIIPFNTTKKNYADLMTESNQSVPQLVLFAEVDFTNAGRWRETYNTENKTEISVTDMVVKTCGHALALMPEMNAYVRPDRIILKRSINIAVTTPVDEGVVAPVVPDVYHKPLYKVSETIRKNTSFATQSKVVLDYDTAFTVSDLGMYGVKRFTPLVTPPQTGCLAVGEIAKRVVPIKDFAGVREIVEITLACDHRAVDGSAAAKFLQIIRDDLESMIPGEDPDWIKGNEQLRLI